MAEPAIKVISIPYQQTVALLQSETLRAVEEAIASEVGSRIIEYNSVMSASLAQADMSVSGLTLAEIESLLVSCRQHIVAFGIRFLRDKDATSNEEEYPEGEEQEPSETEEVHGLGKGFGINYAIYYNFLANRTPAEFRAYLKNRRIPHAAKFAKELRRVFEEAAV